LKIYDTKLLEIPIRHIPFPYWKTDGCTLLEEAHSALDIFLLEYKGRITISFQEWKCGLMGCIRLLILSVNNLENIWIIWIHSDSILPPYYQDILEWTGSHEDKYQNGKMRCLEMNNPNHWKCLTRWTFDAVAKHNIRFVVWSFISSHKLRFKLTTLQLSLLFT
jgi:hypothetical protein